MTSTPLRIPGALIGLVLLAGCAARPELAIRSAASGSVSTSSTTTTPLSRSTTSSTATRSTTSTPVPPTSTTVGAGTVPAPASGVRGTVLFGPVCPVERNPPDPRCAPRPGPARIDLVGSDGRSVSVEAGADGRFSIAAGPGTYVVRATATTPGPGRGCQADPPQVAVAAGSFTPVAVMCDTGIR